MLTQLAVDHGVTQQAIFVAIGPRLNRRIQAAFRAYDAELIAAFYALLPRRCLAAIDQTVPATIKEKLAGGPPEAVACRSAPEQPPQM